MNNVNKITPDDIKKITAMSNSEIEKKLKDILSNSKNGALKKMITGVDIGSMKKKLQSSSKNEIDSFMGILGKLDPSLISKIKDALK